MFKEPKALRAEIQLLRETVLDLKDETGEAMLMRMVLLQGPFQFRAVRGGIWSRVAYGWETMKYGNRPGRWMLDDTGLRLQ